MKIGIDARFYGIHHTGIGRYVQNLIISLGKKDKQNDYIIFGPKEILPDIATYSNFHLVELTTKPYTIAEQIINSVVFLKADLDLLHVPHFYAPILYPKKLVITIHDLIKHYSTGRETTTLPPLIYFLKHILYKIIIFINIHKAVAIITPTNYWKEILVKSYSIDSSKINVTYEAAAFRHPLSKPVDLTQYDLSKPYLIYTGNLYPHKNVNFLIQAIKQFNLQHEHHLQLAVISARDAFTNKLKQNDVVKLLGFIPDEEIPSLYSQAIALVQPSLIEGFGLTGLEAMDLGLPVLSSNTSCLPEVYANAALYFNPKDQADLISRLDLIVHHPEIREELIKQGLVRVKHFSWYKMAKDTLVVYKKCV